MKKKRIISAILVVCMLITSLPLETFAVENAERINPFSDITKQDWFYEDALYAYENNLFSGTSANTFSPNIPMTRAMYVTVIGRMENIDTSVFLKNSTFTDVEKGSYYAPYVEWAKQMGITSGTGNGMFSPDNLITRQDMATFTTRFFDAYGYIYPDASYMTLPKDIELISSYAKDSVLKLWSVGLLKGDENGNFNPLKTATRAETAAFCSRIHQSENSEIQTSGNIINNKKTTYEVKFETNGGGTIASQKFRSGVAMDNLPIPFKENSIFEGWCYDEELSLPIATTDTVKNNMTLYAKYLETKPLEEYETPVFASALDQSPDFTIEVVSTQEMTADEVKNCITAKNLSSIKQEDFINVTGSKKNFVIHGTNGFEKGATYKLTLDNENLSFEGFPDSVRDYNFTVAKEKALNFSLNSDIIYVPASEIVRITGKTNAPITLNESGISETAPSGGNFTYSGSTEIKVGDNLAIYEGTRPDLRSVDNDNDGDILYVKIIGKSGNSYTYTGVEIEEVLFTPDVLPISNSADTDADASNYSVTVSKDILDFSGDIYQNIGLDSQTTIDVGDFISFYDGDFGYNMQDISYAKITAVSEDEDNFVIKFKTVTQEEMFASMDAYDTNQISGEEMLENVNKDAIERSVERQALNSGFAEEAALYLASLALKTDSYTELSSAYDLTDIQIKSKDGDDLTDGEIMLMDGQKVEVDISKLQANLGTKLDYFGGYDGLRLTLEIGIEIKIHASDKADIVMEITGKFEQEVRIDINVDGGAVWKWWGPFPYISEYEATASVDLFDYTGIGIEATIITAEAEEDDLTGMKNETINDIGKQLKDLMDAKDKYIGDGSGTVAEGLADKYKNMIENEDSEWVELFSKDIFKKEFNICLIIAVEVGVEFVVSANVNISLGMDFYYANAKRYVYTVAVFANNVTSDVIDILEEQYQFEFYVMGTLGLRAGIRAGIKVGLFTTKLASVGFTAEVGAYVRVWGYFYYQLRWTASQGKTTKYCGAMLFELGIYLEVKFEAQAFNGTFSYNPTLYDNEWPLWYAGMRENIQDFSYEQEETPELSMKKTIQTVDVPDSIFEMEYMDLKTGETETKVFNDETNFNIKMSNDAFSYNPNTNRLTISPGEKSIQEGQMIITWITAPLAFTSAPIERRINLYWDNYNDGYSIAFNSNGGSSVPIIIQRYGGNVKPPEAPLKQGYIFEGWYSDSSLKNKYTVPSAMPDKDSLVYAKWTPGSDTKYEVLHYKQDINNNYSLADKDTLSGTTDSTIVPETKTYAGFASPVLQETVINPDGSTKVNYYYKRNTYTANFEPGDAGGETVTNKIKYGAAVTAPTLTKEGYEFTGWNEPIAASMPAGNITYTALWSPKGDIDYRIEHYVMQPDGRYKFKEFEYKKGITDEIISASNLKKSAIEVENGITYSYATVKGNTAENAAVKSDGSLVVKLYYDLSQHNITFKSQNGESDIQKIFKYGEVITLPDEPMRTGYTFGGWYTDEACTAALNRTMPAKDVTAFDKRKTNTDTAYKVEHYVMDTDGTYPSIPSYSYNLTGTTDTVCELSGLKKAELLVANGIEYSHGEVNGKTETQAKISGDGSLVVSLYYERKSYTLTWETGEGIASGDYTQSGSIYYGSSVTPPALSRAGYTYAWDKTILQVMPAGNCTYTAVWTANTNTPYKVEHYVMGTDGKYSVMPVDTDNKSGTTDTTCTLSDFTKSGLLAANGIEYSHAEIEGKTETETIISGDGSLVVRLYYERKTHTLTWETGKGTASGDYTQGGSIYYGSPVTPPALSRAGYTYVWDKTINPLMPAENCTYTAVWTANTNTPYKVEHYVMGTDGKYSAMPVNTDNKSGTTDTMCTLSDLKKAELLAANGIEYSHGEVNGKNETEVNISGDGSLVVKLYYERKAYTLKWEMGEGVASGDYTQGGSIYYGSSVTPPTLSRAGYTYVWDKTINPVMPADNCTYTAVWTANTNTKYTVEHYQQNIANDNYTLKDRDTLTGTTDTTAEAKSKGYNYFTLNPDAYSYLESGKISGNGLLLLKLFYDRNKFKVTFDAGDGTLEEDATQELKHGATVSTINPKRSGYAFGGWYFDENCSDDERFNGIMPTNDITLFAKWVAGQVSYRVEHYVMDTKGNYPKIADVSENKTDFADIEVELAGLKNSSLEVINGIQFEEAKIGSDISTSTAISADGTLVVKMYYGRSQYELFWDLDGGTADNNYTEGNIYYGAPIIIPKNLTKTGYTYEWDNTPSVTMPANDLTYAAEWTANSYSVIFNANDGTNTTKSQDFIYDEENQLTKNTFERTGYTFSGWAKEANGENVYDDSESIKNLTSVQNGEVFLYAVWTPISYTITYNTKFESVGNGSYTIENAVNLPALSHMGYIFDGWYDNEQYSGEPVTQIAENSTGNKSFYAKWTAYSYSVIFNANDGTNTTMAQDYIYGEENPLAANTFERTGYTFSGWAKEPNGEKVYNDSESIKNLTAVQGGKVYLYAVWTPISYTITYNTKFEIIGNSSYTIEDAVNLPVLSHTGYIFDGWYDNEQYSGEPVTQIAENSTGNKLFYAKWIENTYSVIFNSNDGTNTTQSQVLMYDEEKALAKNTFERTGYTFSGWAKESNGEKVYDDGESIKNLTAVQDGKVHLYAVWAPISYTITYNTIFESVGNGSYTVEDAVNLLALSHKGYTFDGWYDNEQYIGEPVAQIAANSTGDKSFYAKWSENTYTISFNQNGGNGEMAPQEYAYTEEKALSTNELTRTGYTFLGWATEANGGKVYNDSQVVQSLTYLPNENINLYAIWQLNTYNISYALNGGTENNNPTQYDVSEGAITLESPSRTGYAFGGWYTDEALVNKASDPAIPEGETGNKEFYAKWIANTYYVNFNANGGSGVMASQSFAYDETPKALTPNSFTLNGYEFKGWSTKSDGSGVPYADETEVRNLLTSANGTVILYAQWTPLTYSISYNLYGGTNDPNNPSNYTIETATVVFKNPAHSAEGNVFAGWYTDSGFNNPITEIPTGSTGSVQVYAKWINCGKFSIVNNGNNTFTISRAGGKDKAQTVYFRTLNGSAIGGTHFTHQENSIVFADGQQSSTVTIAESGANTMYNNNAATAYANAAREYFVEIYDVSGGATISGTAKAKHTMSNNSSYSVSESDMTSYKNIASVTKSSGGRSGLQVYESSGGGYKGTLNIGLNSNALNTTAYGSLSNYIYATADGMKVQLKNFKGTDDGWRMYRYVLFNTSSNNVSFSSSKNGDIPNLPSGTKAVLVYGISTDTDNKDSYSVSLPAKQSSTISATGTGKTVSVKAARFADGQPSTNEGYDYVLYGLNEGIGISVGAYNSAAPDSSWWFNSAELYTMPYDKSGPDYLGTAPMSNTSYKLGSKVTIALVFDEIIKSADGVTVLTNLSNNVFTLAGGIGTNVLYFEGTVTNTSTSASVTTINSKTNIKDMLGNAAK